MVVKYHSGLAVLLAFSSAVLAQITTPCTYQEYLCGSTLLTNGALEFLEYITLIKAFTNIAIQDMPLLI